MHPADWKKGQHEDYDCFVVEVYTRKNKHSGELQSLSRLQASLDNSTAASFSPTQGLEEASWALLLESLRTEAVLQLLMKLSTNPDIVAECATAENRSNLLENLSDTVSRQVAHIIGKSCYGICESALKQLELDLKKG